MANVLRWTGRLIGAALLGTTAGIHAYLWHSEGYRHIPTIGHLFLLTAITASVLCILVLTVPQRLVALVALVGAGFELSVVLGLAITVNHTGGLFGFTDSSLAPLFWLSVWTEIAGTIVLGLLFLDGAARLIRTRGRGQVLVSHA
jgi:hypothetical protein